MHRWFIIGAAIVVFIYAPLIGAGVNRSSVSMKQSSQIILS